MQEPMFSESDYPAVPESQKPLTPEQEEGLLKTTVGKSDIKLTEVIPCLWRFNGDIVDALGFIREQFGTRATFGQSELEQALVLYGDERFQDVFDKQIRLEVVKRELSRRAA